MVYNFPLPPLVLHTLVTGDASALTKWASDLAPPSHQTAFLNFLDSHDGIGLLGAKGILTDEEIQAMCEHVKTGGGFVSMKDNGDGTESPYELNATWFSAINGDDSNAPEELQIDRLIASRAIALVLRGVPAIYLPSMFGSRNDVEAVYRDNSRRSINRTAYQEEKLLIDMARENSRVRRIMSRFDLLLQRRVDEQAFHPNASQKVYDLGPRVFVVERTAIDASSRVLCLINVSAESLTLNIPVKALSFPAGEVVDLISGDTFAPEQDAWHITLEPYQVAWLKQDGDAAG